MARLLIVEDDPDTNDSICEYLKDAGHKVHAAFDGKQALVLFENLPIDAIVLDIMLPQLSGLEVLREIRQNSDVPVLMLTAIKDEGTQITSFDRLYHQTLLHCVIGKAYHRPAAQGGKRKRCA
mgnify:CR=1 FL=1